MAECMFEGVSKNSRRMGVRDMRYHPKSYVAQRRHTVMFIIETSGCVIGVGIDLGFVVH